MVKIKYDEEVRRKFPGLKVKAKTITDVKIKKSSEKLENLKERIIERINRELSLKDLKDMPIFRAYRDFFWDLGIDPTKTRPAAEALVRRALKKGGIPSINTLVDTYNIASLESKIPLAAFDYEYIEGELKMRFSKKGEKFLGIGMENARELDGNEIVIADSEKPIAIYPYRDSEETKVTLSTEDALLMVCGAPGVESELKDAEKKMANYVKKFCDGKEK